MISFAQFRSALGVNVHWTDGSRNAPDIAADMKAIGITSMRGRAPQSVTDTWSANRLSQLVAGGMSHYTMLVNTASGPNWMHVPTSPADTIAQVRAFQKAHPSVSTILEGPNEPQNWPLAYAGLVDVKGVYGATAHYMADLLPLASGLTIVGPSWDPVPAQPAACDLANQHLYPYCGPPTPGQPWPFLAGKIAEMLAPYAGKPWMATEGGYSSGVNGGTMSTNAAVQAKLLLCAIAQSFRLGCQEFDIYELYDGSADVTVKDWSQCCGLYTNGRVIKPAGIAVKNLLAFLATGTATTAQPFVPPPGVYAFQIGGDLLLWNEPLLWDWQHRTEISPTPVSLSLPSTATVYDPILDAHATTNSVTLRGYPLVIRA